MIRLIAFALLLLCCPVKANAQAFSFADIPFLAQGVQAPYVFAPVSSLLQASDYLTRGAGLTGAADSKQGILSFWYKPDSDSMAEQTLFVANYPTSGSQIGVHIYRLGGTSMWIDLYDSSGTRIMGIEATGFSVAAGWTHVLCAWDLATTTCDLYVNGIAQGPAFDINDATIDYTQPNWFVGCKSDASDFNDACVSEFYFNFGEFLDLTDIDNRRKFYNAGEPVDMGADGSIPTGTAPEVYFREWTGVNAGSGGNFTLTSELTACDAPQAPFTPVAATFDGANDYMLRGAGLTGAADSKVLTVSFWAKFNEDGSDYQTIFIGNYPAGGNPGLGVFIYRLAAQRIYVECYNAAGTKIFGVLSHASVPFDVASGWRHFMCSVNLATASQHLYVDGVDSIVTDVLTDDTIDYTQTEWCIGAIQDGTLKTDCCISELYINIAEYVDLSVSGNRLKFYNAGNPVDLGSDGSTPTGNAPAIYMKAWSGANAGSGGNFSITGSLDSCTPP